MKDKFRLIVTIITLSIFVLMSVGYATYNIRMTVAGSVGFKANGEVSITNVVLSDYSNLQNPVNPTFTKDNISFDLYFNVENNSALDDDYYAEYDVTIENDSFFDYEFASSVFNPSIETQTNENMNYDSTLDGIEIGDIIPSKDSKTFKVRIIMYPNAPGEYNVSGDTNVTLEEEEEEPTGSLIAGIPKNSTIDLRGNTVRDKVTVTVINSYSDSKTFTFTMSNNNFKLVNSSGVAIGNFTIAANTTDTYDVYIERKNGVTFATNQQSVNLVLSSNLGNSSVGSVKVLVDKDETLLDDDPPVISDVNATFVAQNGKVNLTWNATDISSISYFIIEAYNSSDELKKTYQTPDGSTAFTATGLANGTYYFKVYGVDSKQNNGKTAATSCTTSAGVCSRSTSATYTWVFSVTYSLGNNISKSSGPTEIAIGETLTAVFTVSGNRSFNNVSATMNGQTLQRNSGYTWSTSGNTGTMNIPNVNGNITINITASSICLVKGTKVLLANGKYKNIEDINYNDLLAVWDYEHGKITYEYPIWIEKEEKTNFYQHNTFSDGSVLNTTGYHGIFSPTYNEFISVDDYDRFKEGTKVTKVVNGKLKEVSVKKVEFINERVSYHHVVSTRYYNIIANDFLTTDGTVILSNLYGFGKNITWNKSVRNNVVNNKNNIYSYDEFKDIMPYYMFKGLRVEEGKYLTNYGLSKEIFKYYLVNNQMNEEMLLSVPVNKNNKRMWMVSTSLNNGTLYEEGSIYTLPNILGVKKWYSTSEDKYYNIYDKVKINHSMHFIAIK